MSIIDHPQWNDYRELLYAIAKAALAAVDPFRAVQQYLEVREDSICVGCKEYSLDNDTKIYVVGAGKAGVSMAHATEDILGARITDGVMAVPEATSKTLTKIRLIQSGHPLPNEGSIAAGKEIAELLEGTKAEDLVLVLISGGGSALLELPVDELQLSDLQTVNDLLIKSGAPIQEINTVRKQLSRLKGGGLGALAAPARTAALILSDVVGDPLDAIASGPTVGNNTSTQDAWHILEEYDLPPKIPEAVRQVLEKSSEEPDPVSKLFSEVNNVIIGSNRIAAEAALRCAQENGFLAILLTTKLQGEASLMGSMVANLVKALKPPVQPEKPLCLILGGETTVLVRGEGVGGRNQELALAAAVELAGLENVAMMSFATDGIDGPTPSAGAIITGATIGVARELGLDPRTFLANNDSHTFFKALGATIDVGLTGTNVNDLIFVCVYPG